MDIEEFYNNTILLTDRQQEAKENLETKLNKTKRGGFSSYEEFNEYMQSLIKQMKKKINLAKAVENGNISYEEINRKKREKILEFYNREDKLTNYAIKYIQKYFPSRKKLFQKLIEKSKNEELSEIIIEALIQKKIQYTDEKLVGMYFNQYISLGKNYKKIKNLLLRKLFDSSLINNVIDSYQEEINGSLLDHFSLTKKIERLLKQGKSNHYILNKFGDTAFDRELINQIFEELNFDNSEVITLALEKIKRQGITEKQKIISRMFSRGFKYDDFKDLLD